MLTRAVGRARAIRPELCRKGWMLMSTYEEFMIILTTAILIVTTLKTKNK